MENPKRQRFFIYDRREMIVLVLLGVMVALFAFTLGVHLGKRVGGKNAPGHVGITGDSAPVETKDDAVASHLEISEQGKEMKGAVEETLHQSLHEEVTKTGIKVDSEIQTRLPEKAIKDTKPKPAPVREGGEKARIVEEQTANPGVEKEHATARPEGAYTLQVGSFATDEEAQQRSQELKAAGLNPFIRKTDVKKMGQWFRVYLGGYPGKAAAEEAGLKFEQRHVIDSFIVSKMP